MSCWPRCGTCRRGPAHAGGGTSTPWGDHTASRRARGGRARGGGAGRRGAEGAGGVGVGWGRGGGRGSPGAFLEGREGGGATPARSPIALTTGTPRAPRG